MKELLTEYWFYFAVSAVVLWLLSPAIIAVIMGGIRRIRGGVSSDQVIDPRPPHITNLTNLETYFADYKDQPTKDRAKRNISELKNDVLPGPDYIPPQAGASA